MSALIKADSTQDAHDGLDELDDEKKEEGQVDQSEYEQNCVCNPSSSIRTDRHLIIC
jgi:hypothetical protein